MKKPPSTHEHHIRMARIYLHEARRTIHRDWKFTLLQWAAERRLKAGVVGRSMRDNLELTL